MWYQLTPQGVLPRFKNGQSRVWYYTYILISKKTGDFYTGATANLRERVTEYSKGLVPSTKYRRPLELIYFEACLNKDDAFRRERYLKSGMGKPR